MTDWVQEWEGCVIEIGETTFWARLIDLTDPGPEEEAEIFLDKILAEKRPLIQPGVIFHWRIGKKGESEFCFSAECWTKVELQQAARLAHRIRIPLDTHELPRWKPAVILWDSPLPEDDEEREGC